MKRHYISKWEYDNRVYVTAACGKDAFTLAGLGERMATYRKQSVKCGNCRKTKIFRGIKAR